MGYEEAWYAQSSNSEEALQPPGLKEQNLGRGGRLIKTVASVKGRGISIGHRRLGEKEPKHKNPDLNRPPTLWPPACASRWPNPTGS